MERGKTPLKKKKGRGSNLKATIKQYYWDPGFVLNGGKLAMQIFLSHQLSMI